MSSKVSHAFVVALFVVALPFAAGGETMTLAEYLSGEPEATAATGAAANENPFADIGLEPSLSAPNAESLRATGLQPYRIEAPDVITIEVAAGTAKNESELSAEIRDAVGRRLVYPDGKINLGNFGNLYINGMTTDEASRAIRRKLGTALPEGKVAVDIYAANSKRYYIVMQYGGPADEVMSCPATGKETVLDAISQTGQAKNISKVWISRPSGPNPLEQILAVDWEKVRNDSSNPTNFALLPSDRVFVQIARTPSVAAVPPTASAADSRTRVAEYIDAVAQTPMLVRKPYVAVIVPGSGTGDSAQFMDFRPDTTVGKMLQAATYPQPIDFKTAKIAVHRANQHINDDLSVEAEEQILRVEWDAETGQPTEKTNFDLQPGDRLFVTQPQPVTLPQPPTTVVAGDYYNPYTPPIRAAASPPLLAATPHPYAPEAPQAIVYSALPTPVPSPYAAQPAAAVAPAVVSEPAAPILRATPTIPSTVRFDVAVVEDVGDSFAEFDELQSRMPFMLADTATMQGTLRILEKHNLVRRLSSPKIIVTAGEKATIVVGEESPGTEQPWQGIKAEMGARELGGGLAVDFSLATTEGRSTNKVQTSLIVPHGQTVVMKTGSQLLQTSADEVTTSDKVEHAVYVVLTPEIVK